ncbi:MAG: NAD(P)/FAD-dependent oxidoreductase [Elainella sp. Prado103]|nr:NAD(P)/FAD-dependent oxidoreductase [Elainella sp. Prado103]
MSPTQTNLTASTQTASIQTDSRNPQATSSIQHHQILIVGGGAAGITTAAQLLSQNQSLDVAIVEPSDRHHYQPGWTLVGGGVAPIEQFTRDQRSVIPTGATWIQDSVTQLDPDQNQVQMASGRTIRYDYLVLCPGIQIDWHLVKGLKEALGQGGVTSNYSREYAPYTWETIQNFQGGTAIFTHPSTPIKCGGAPQKVMYMADDYFKSKSNVGVNTQVMFCTAGAKMFLVPAYSTALEKIAARRNILTRFKYDLKEIDADRQAAIFSVTTDQGMDEVSLHYDMIHVTPPMSAPDFIKQSPLANAGGWIDVHKHTLQHVRYANVFSLGDASSLPTSKTAAAIRKEAPVLVQNLLAVLDGRSLDASYNGYTCCPLITGYHSLLMAEFDYDLNLVPSFPLDSTKERYSMYLAKVHVLPWLYWNRMLKGKSFEADLLKPINQVVHR